MSESKNTTQTCFKYIYT